MRRKSYSYRPNNSISGEEKKAYRRLLLSFGLIIFLAITLYLWGTNIVFFVGDFWRDFFPEDEELSTNTQDIILPPQVDPLPLYTNKKQTDISGWGQSGFEVEIFVNGKEIAQILVDKNNRFELPAVDLVEGENAIACKTITRDQSSALSEEQHVILDTEPPSVEFTVSDPNQDNVIQVAGSVENNVDVYINHQRVILDHNNQFQHDIQAQEGENSVEIEAIDLAGNSSIFHESVTILEDGAE